MNLVVLKGNLTKDVELRYSPSGTAVGKSSIAISDGYKDKQNTYFFNLTFFGKTAEMANQYLYKGSQVLVKGKLVQESWTDNMGNKKQNVSITVENMEFCGTKNQNQTQNNPQPAQYQQPQRNTPQPQQNIPTVDIDEDEIPF